MVSGEDARLPERAVGVGALDVVDAVVDDGALNITGARSRADKQPAARELVREGDGLIARNNILCAAMDTMRKRLPALLQQARNCAGGFAVSKPLSIERPSRRRPLQLLASPVSGSGTARILLLATDPEKPVVLRDDVLQEHYGLTGAETEVANGLLTGYSLEEIAALRKVKIGTVRDQVKSMLAKTVTSRQMEMVKLLLTLPRM